MGWWYVRQPNGLLARFSTVVDDFTAYDMTEDEAREDALDGPVGVGRVLAAEKVADAMADVPGLFVTGEHDLESDGLNRFRRAIATVAAIHGKKVAREREAELSQPVDPGD